MLPQRGYTVVREEDKEGMLREAEGEEGRWKEGEGEGGMGKVDEGEREGEKRAREGARRKSEGEGGSTCRRERRRESGRRRREGGGWGREGGERTMGEETEGQGKADGEEIIGRDEHVLLADSNALKTNTTSDPLHLFLILPARVA